MGSSNYHLSGPLIKKLKIAISYNSINNLDIGGAPVRKQLSQICFASKSYSIQSQFDFFTNVTIERFVRIKNSDNAADFLKSLILI